MTLFVGLAYLMAGAASSRPTAFWFHLAAGTLIGGSLLYWWHGSDADWALISVAALVYVAIAYGSKRSSWAVLATVGLLAASGHFALEWTHVSVASVIGGQTAPPRDWVPSLVFAFTGFLLVALGLRGRRRAP